MQFSRQEYQSALPFPSPGDLPDSGIEPISPALQADSLPLPSLFEPPVGHKKQTQQNLKLDQLDLNKIRLLCIGNLSTDRKGNVQIEEKFANHIPDQNLVSRRYKDLLQLNKKSNNLA